ncbi:MAG: carboxypeptidase-like regulatory domain-containing protein, partial [Cyclobacteriaceae bacterium]
MRVGIWGGLRGALLCLLCIGISLLSNAQSEITVSGKVTDNTGVGLPSVNIIIENTTTGVVSDLDGNFTIQANSNQVLIFRMVGMEEVRQPINGRTSFNITLSESTDILDEVVVTGFQEVERKLFTGASENVKMSDIKIDGLSDVG